MARRVRHHARRHIRKAAVVAVATVATVGVLEATGTPVVSRLTDSACACTVPSFPLPVATVAPVVSGSAVVGQVLSTTTGTWSNTPLSYTYQWQTSGDGTAWSNLGGATSSSYTIQAGDASNYLRSTVLARNANGVAASAAASLSTGIVSAGGGGGGGGSVTANVFVAPPSSAGLGTHGADGTAGVGDGVDCTRVSVAVAAPPDGAGYGCATLQQAYRIASAGDTVGLNWDGTWASTTAQIIGPSNNKSGTGCRIDVTTMVQTVSGCVTFTPADSRTPVFTNSTTSCASGPCGTAVKFCADQIRFLNAAFAVTRAVPANQPDIHTSNGAITIGNGDSTCMPSSATPHDIIIDHASSGGAFGLQGGADHVYLINSTVGDQENIPSQFGAAGNNGASDDVNHSAMIGNAWVRSTADHKGNYHQECIHMDGGGHDNVVRDNTFFAGDCGGSGVLRVEAEKLGGFAGNEHVNELVEGNVFGATATNTVTFDCHDNGCLMNNNVFRFNTFVAGSFTPTDDCQAGTPGTTCLPSGNLAYGNLYSSTGSGCPSNGAAFGIGWVSYRNLMATSQTASSICTVDNSSLYSQTVTLNSDGTLNGCGQPAANFADVKGVTGYPSSDPLGVARPQGAGVDAGALETCNAGTHPGQSQAVCAASSCTSGTAPSSGSLSTQPSCTPGVLAGGSVNEISVGSINDGVTSSCRMYGYYTPTNFAFGRPAAILVASGTNGFCGVADPPQIYKSNHWHTTADANAMVVIYLSKAYNGTSCTSGAEPVGWRHPTIDSPDPGAGVASDVPYLTAVITDIQSRFSVDPGRIYLTGSSGGGSLVLGAACDDTARGEIRGFDAVSAWLQTVKSGSVQVTGTERCNPAGSGTGTSYNGGTGSSTNHSFFLMHQHGTNDGNVAFNGQCLTTHCFSGYSEESAFWKAYMGCATGPTTTNIGSPSALNALDDYSACSFTGANQVVEMEKVTSGCHSWEGLDANVESGSSSTCVGGGSTNSTNAFNSSSQAWSWLSTRTWP